MNHFGLLVDVTPVWKMSSTIIALMFAGFVNTILSWSAFVPLSRLTYCIYLLHLMLMELFLFNLNTLFYMNELNIVSLCVGHFWALSACICVTKCMLWVCVCVCVCVCAHACVCICMCVCVCACVCMCACVCACVCVCVCVCVSECVCWCVCACVCVCVCACVCSEI